MTYIKVLNVLIAFASLAFVLTLAWQMRRNRLPLNRAIVALVIVFALRAGSRPFPPFGEDPLHLISILDTVLLVAMIILVLDGRKIVQAFQTKRRDAERTQIEYDLALQSLDAGDEQLDAQLERIEESARAALEPRSSDAERQRTLREVAEAVAVIRRGHA